MADDFHKFMIGGQGWILFTSKNFMEEAQSVNNLNWWDKYEAIARLQGYRFTRFEWVLKFKPENHYLTSDGYPLGTTCWFVVVCACGFRRNYCADTPQEAVENAIAGLLEKLETSLNDWDSQSRTPPDDWELRQWRELFKKVKDIVSNDA